MDKTVVTITKDQKSDIKDQKSIRQLLAEKDEVSLCTPDGKIIGREDKYKAHEYPSKLHLAISVWLFNSKGEVLLQKRSPKKIVGAGWWANTVCGNVWPTETYFECALRRLRVELGIEKGVVLKPLYKFLYKAYGNQQYGEHELDQVYGGIYEGKINPNPDEVSDYAWVNFEELYSQVMLTQYVSPEESILLQTKQLQEKTKPVTLQMSQKKFTIAPWTIFMLQNSTVFDFYKIECK